MSRDPGQFIIPILYSVCMIWIPHFQLSFGAIIFIHHSHGNCSINMKLDLNHLETHNSSHIRCLIILSCTRATLWTLWGASYPRAVGWAVLGHEENWPTHPLLYISGFTGPPADTRAWLLPSWYKVQQTAGLYGMYKAKKAKLWLWEGCLRVAGSDIRSEEHKTAPNLPSEWLIGLSWVNIDNVSSTARLCCHIPLMFKVNSVIIPSPGEKWFAA